MTDTSLSEDAFVFGDGALEKEKVTLEKKVYDVLLKRNADLMDENARLREALEVILDALQEEAKEKYYLIKRLNELEAGKNGDEKTNLKDKKLIIYIEGEEDVS